MSSRLFCFLRRLLHNSTDGAETVFGHLKAVYGMNTVLWNICQKNVFIFEKRRLHTRDDREPAGFRPKKWVHV